MLTLFNIELIFVLLWNEEKMILPFLKSIKKKKFMMNFLIKKENDIFKSMVYTAEDIIYGKSVSYVDEIQPRPLAESFAEVIH